MPVWPETVPVLTMPPRNVETFEIEMPLPVPLTELLPISVPPLEMPPENVVTELM
jgi:hypothetical protein